MTDLDAAHAAMAAAPDDDAARLRYYARLADAELFLLLAAEAEGGRIAPRVFPLEDGPVVLAFDSEERLAAFAAGPAPYAALAGRTIAAQLAGQGIGLGVNLGEDTAMLLPAEAMGWLAALLDRAPQTVAARPRAVHPPGALPGVLMAALDAKLARAGGLATGAVLAGVEYEDGRRGHLLAFIGAAPGAEEALARAAGEALTFSGLDAGEMDVAFLDPADPVAAAMGRAGIAIELPAPPPQPGAPADPPPPGMDGPPRLR
jgi:hypothetical protein